jgi:hypothetical protein
LFTNSSGHPAHVPTMASAKWDKKSSGQWNNRIIPTDLISASINDSTIQVRK